MIFGAACAGIAVPFLQNPLEVIVQSPSNHGKYAMEFP